MTCSPRRRIDVTGIGRDKTTMRGASKSEIRFLRITEYNVLDVCALKVRDDQQELICDNAVALAQALVTKNCWYRAIYAGDTLVGFILTVQYPRKKACYLWRFMIDRAHQGRGYGQRALDHLVRLTKKDKEMGYIYLRCCMLPGNASALYSKLGFIERVRLGDDAVMWLSLRKQEGSQ
jgi:diamine N-acetyltransferase